jgi:hypothetical protein
MDILREEDVMEPKLRSHKWAFVVAVALGIFILLLVIALTVATSVTSNALDRTLAKLKSEGFRTSPEGVMPICSDDENAAIPWEQARQLFSLKTKAASNAFNKTQQNWSSLSSEDKRALREAIAANQRVLDLIREAVSRPCFTFQPDYSQPMAKWRRPNLAGAMRMLHLLIAVRGRLALEDGKRGDALECCTLGVKCARSAARLGYFLSSMMSLLFLNMSLDLCQETMAGAPIPQEVAHEMITLLNPQFLRDGIASGLDMDRLMHLDSMRRMLAGEKMGWFNPRMERAMRLFGWPLVQRDAALVQELMVREIKAIRSSYRDAMDEFPEIAHEVDNLSKIHIIAHFTFPSLEDVAERLADSAARAQVTRLALACKLYADKTGAFPSSLDQLVPDYFKELPRDPFTGKNLIYRILPEGGFVVYSVGPNGRDDLKQYASHRDLRKLVFSARPQQIDDLAWLEPPAR